MSYMYIYYFFCLVKEVKEVKKKETERSSKKFELSSLLLENESLWLS